MKVKLEKTSLSGGRSLSLLVLHRVAVLRAVPVAMRRRAVAVLRERRLPRADVLVVLAGVGLALADVLHAVGAARSAAQRDLHDEVGPQEVEQQEREEHGDEHARHDRTLPEVLPAVVGLNKVWS